MRGIFLLALLTVTSTWGTNGFALSYSCEDIFNPSLEIADNASTAMSPRIRAEQPDAVGEFLRLPNDTENGLVTDRLPINVETLTAAYTRGIFPWAVTPEGNGIWFTPPRRGILDFTELEVGNSDRKLLRKLEARVASGELRVTFDTAFERVIQECAAQIRLRRDPRTGLVESMGTWITPEIMQAYTAMFKAGRAHSVEIWKGDELVGGSYGTSIAGVFSGESMFHKIDDVAKLGFMRLIEKLKSFGYQWVDTQVAPPDSKSLTVKWGAREISREEYLARLKTAAENPARWPVQD